MMSSKNPNQELLEQLQHDQQKQQQQQPQHGPINSPKTISMSRMNEC